MITENKNNLLEMLAAKDKDWKMMVRSIFNKKKSYQEDVVNEIVQLMYMRLYKYVDDPDKIMYNDEINTMFVYITLRNIYYNYYKELKTTDEVDYNEYTDENYNENYGIENSEDMIKLQDDIRSEIETWNNYDSKLFKIIYFDGVSMRQLERETGIKLSSIFNTIKKSKLKLKYKLQNKYNKIIN